MVRTQLSRSVKVKTRAHLWLLISKNSGEETEEEARMGTRTRALGQRWRVVISGDGEQPQ